MSLSFRRSVLSVEAGLEECVKVFKVEGLAYEREKNTLWQITCFQHM